ncbi:MAG: hypothetical protein GY799_13345 [Desulfobulbaceae bacterium]|nr:hypothetical protein [Desulfobulbaceae bacterium]
MYKHYGSTTILLCIFFVFCNAIAGDRITQIDELIEKYGKREIVNFLLEKSSDWTITVQVSNKLHVKGGRPSTEYITAYSIDNDLKRIGFTVKQADTSISKSITHKKIAAEKKKREDKARDERKIWYPDNATKNFVNTLSKFFPKSVLKSSAFDKGTGIIIFRQNTEYFGTGDKINKIHAIESARLFRDVSELKALRMTIPLSDKTYVLNINRQTIQRYYNINFGSLKGDLEAWRTKFIQQYDSKRLRARFAAKFVRIN